MATSTIFTSPSPFRLCIYSKNFQSNNVSWSLLGSTFLFNTLTSSFSSLLPGWEKIQNTIFTSRSNHSNIVPVHTLRLCGGCQVPCAVHCGGKLKYTKIYPQKFTLTHFLSENKQFLHSYGFPPFLA